MIYDQDLGQQNGGAVAELCAKLDLHIGSTDRLARQMRAAQRKPPAQPVFGRTSGVGTYESSTGYMSIRLAQRGPDQGHFWYVRSIVAGGLSPTIAVTGRADIYVTAADPRHQGSLAGLGLGDWRDWADFTPGIAQIAFYGRGEMALRLNEKLYAVVTGGTNAQQYAVAVSYEDYEEAAVKEEWSV